MIRQTNLPVDADELQCLHESLSDSVVALQNAVRAAHNIGLEEETLNDLREQISQREKLLKKVVGEQNFLDRRTQDGQGN